MLRRRRLGSSRRVRVVSKKVPSGAREFASVATANQRLKAPGFQPTGIVADHGENRPTPGGIGEPGPGSSSLLCILGLREARLDLPALRGFRLELAVNRTQFAFRIDRWDRDGHTIMDHVAEVQRFDGCYGRLRSGLSALARRDHNAASRRQSHRGEP